jgi:predicted dithiol-disulfide oxidoreductase (DUF899 family)
MRMRRFKEETNMSELRYPNESREYRDARESLLIEEQELVDKVRSVAEKRRNLPLGGRLKEDYVFQWANDGKVGKKVAIAKATAERINAWARQRGWSQIALVSGTESAYQADYKCQGDSDDMQWPVMHVFRKHGGTIFHFWGTEVSTNHVDTVWPYWNLMDFTPEGRPDIPTPPQRSSGRYSWKNTI